MCKNEFINSIVSIIRLFNDYIHDACGPEKSKIFIEGLKEINNEFLENMMRNFV